MLAGAATFAQTPPPFRSGVDLVAVDVDIVDRDGAPVADLGPDDFQVSIDGKPRKLVSAEFVRVQTPSSSAAAPRATPPTVVPAVGSARQPAEAPGRIYILAVDSMSFSPLEVAPAREAARALIERLQPNDLAGLAAFPTGPTVELSTDRAPLLAALGGLTGQAVPNSADPYQLAPSEIVDLSRALPPPFPNPPDVVATIGRICASSDDPESCSNFIVPVGHMEAQVHEMEIEQRLGALDALFRSLAASPRRKIVVLVSGGILGADRGDGRPDLSNLLRTVGQRAAEANCAVYTLFFDRVRADMMSASRRTVRQHDLARDGAILAAPLGAIADAAGGAFFLVVQGGGEFAFDRILCETSAYYLLGVEPDARDRDGRPHQLRVKVTRRGVIVRSRTWVTLPKTNPPASAAIEVAVARPPKPLPDSVRPLAEAYARGDYAAAADLLAHAPNLANLLMDLRQADVPWPEAPHRGAVFLLEVAIAGLSSPNRYARDEALRLLTQTHVTVERSPDIDFACRWDVAEAAGLEGLWQPEMGLALVDRARRRCPAEPRLALARAVLVEQQSRDSRDPAVIGRVLTAYQEVAAGSDAGLEAGVRASLFAYRHGDIARAEALLPPAAGAARDSYVRYFHDLANGQVLRARNRLDDAAAAYRSALQIAPGAQSARVALMTLQLARGRPGEAAALSDEVLDAGPDRIDPWWTYLRGDARLFGAIVSTLRGSAD